MRHQIIWSILRPPLSLFLKLKFKYTYKVAKDLPENYIVLSNHTTDYDCLLLALCFPKFMHYVASEHVARWNFISKLINYAFEPIWRYKGTVAASTVLDVLRKTKAGHNVALFAEGNRCWDGVTTPIVPSTGKMIKAAGCGLVTFKLTGGYLSSPRWSKENTRKGYLHGEVANVYTKEQLAKMTVEEINQIIHDDLHEDAYERQLQEPKKYTGKNLAKHMENLLFICPKCGKIDTIQSSKDKVTCSSCDLEFTYNEYGMLEGLDFKTVKELVAWQKDELEKLAQTNVTFTSSNGGLITVKNHVESPVAVGEVKLSPEKLVCGDFQVPLADISEMALHGCHGLVFTANKKYYELTPYCHPNALKFLMLYEAYSKK